MRAAKSKFCMCSLFGCRFPSAHESSYVNRFLFTLQLYAEYSFTLSRKATTLPDRASLGIAMHQL